VQVTPIQKKKAKMMENVYFISFLSAKFKDSFQFLLLENVETIKIFIFNNLL